MNQVVMKAIEKRTAPRRYDSANAFAARPPAAPPR